VTVPTRVPIVLRTSCIPECGHANGRIINHLLFSGKPCQPPPLSPVLDVNRCRTKLPQLIFYNVLQYCTCLGAVHIPVPCHLQYRPCLGAVHIPVPCHLQYRPCLGAVHIPVPYIFRCRSIYSTVPVSVPYIFRCRAIYSTVTLRSFVPDIKRQ
jgi:hypothetical protein